MSSRSTRNPQLTLLEMPTSFICPLTMDTMTDPVTLVRTGQTYERASIQHWLINHDTCPLTNVNLNGNKALADNFALKSAIAEWAGIVEATLKSLKHEIPYSDLVIESQLASGRTKDICKGTWHGKPVAVCISKGPTGAMSEREADILSTVGKHPNVVRFLGRSINEQGQHVLVLELVPEGKNLSMLVSELDDQDKEMSYRSLLILLIQIVCGMEEICSHGVVHKDLSCRNILVFSFDDDAPEFIRVKVSDFGMSSVMEQSTCYYYTDIGGALPIRWMAPESLSKNKWSEKSDVYSFGVLIWEILSRGQVPWGFGVREEQVQAHVLAGDCLPCEDNWPDKIVELLTRCCAKNPRDRPSFSDLRTALTTLLSAERTAAAPAPAPTERAPALVIKTLEIIDSYTGSINGKYVGQTLNDKRHGHGTETYTFLPCPYVHTGEWADDKPCGRGVRDFEGGFRAEGEWEGHVVNGDWRENECVLSGPNFSSVDYVNSDLHPITLTDVDNRNRSFNFMVPLTASFEFVMMLFWQKTSQTPYEMRFIVNEKSVRSGSLLSLGIQPNSEFKVWKAFRGDIGHFGTHVDTPGVCILHCTMSDVDFIAAKNTMDYFKRKCAISSLDYVQKVVESIKKERKIRMTCTEPLFQSNMLNHEKCHILRLLVDQKFHALEQGDNTSTTDFKCYLTLRELSTYIGADTVSALTEKLSGEVNKVIIRRCEAKGLCINFHTDYAQQTLQVALNDHTEYEGGRLVYALDKGDLFAPFRKEGCMVVHDNTVVHGVTKHTAGVRYGLFLLRD